MFQFTGFATHDLCIQSRLTLAGRVSPFRYLRIKALLPAPRSFSQAYTSFVACNRQGIHHMHLFAWPYNVKSSVFADQSNITSFYFVSRLWPLPADLTGYGLIQSKTHLGFTHSFSQVAPSSCLHESFFTSSKFLKNNLKQFLSKSWYLNHVSLDQA